MKNSVARPFPTHSSAAHLSVNACGARTSDRRRGRHSARLCRLHARTALLPAAARGGARMAARSAGRRPNLARRTIPPTRRGRERTRRRNPGPDSCRRHRLARILHRCALAADDRAGPAAQSGCANCLAEHRGGPRAVPDTARRSLSEDFRECRRASGEIPRGRSPRWPRAQPAAPSVLPPTPGPAYFVISTSAWASPATSWISSAASAVLNHAKLQQYLGYVETRRGTQISVVAEVASAYLTLLAGPKSVADHRRYARQPAGVPQAHPADFRRGHGHGARSAPGRDHRRHRTSQLGSIPAAGGAGSKMRWWCCWEPRCPPICRAVRYSMSKP